MTLPQADAPAPVPAAKPLNTSMRWLVGISLLCLMLVFGLRRYFDHLETQIRQRGDNERARLFVGDEIVHGIREVEKDYYRLAVTQNQASFARIDSTINRNLDKLEHDLNVLQNGGTTRRMLRLNVDGQDEVTRDATYRAEANSQALVMEIIEIEPQISQIRAHTSSLLQLLTKRWQAMDSGRAADFLAAEEEVVLSLKQIPPQFERITENANRLFLEGDQRLRDLETNLAAQSARLRQVETLLISLVVVLGGTLVLLFMRRLASALEETRRARDDTESQRQQNATILDTLADGVYTTDLDGIITYVNAAAERILGWRAADLVGTNAHQAIHVIRPDGSHYPQTACPLYLALRQGDALHGEDHFVHRDGRCIPVSFGSKPLTLKGALVGSLLSFQDITERLAARSQIRLQQSALDAAANVIVITSRAGLIEYVNPAFTQTTGYSAEEAVGQSTKMLKSGLQGKSFYSAMWQTLLTGKPWEGELTNRRKNGEVYPEQMTVTPITHQGEITHFVAIKRDISEEIRTRTRMTLIESAIAETDQGIYILDAEPHPEGPLIQYVNAGFCRLTGYTAPECVGARAGFLRGPQTDPDKVRQVVQAIAQGQSITLEMDYQHKDGTPLVSEVHLSPVHSDLGQVTHYIGVLTDIGLRKQVEAALLEARDQALENSRLKSEFLSTMSHEIRTPMNGIIGMTDLLLDTPQDDEQREFTTIVHDSAQALLVIINDILDFSKIAAGKLDIEITEFSVGQVLQGTLELLAGKARHKALALSSHIDPKLPLRLAGDPTRLRQVLLNLIGNAIKFTDTGSVTVRAYKTFGLDQAMLRIDITDTGIGITPATQAKLFQSFTQADSSTTRKYGGTGLGLVICKRLVELMGGHIGVDSEIAKGSTFWFTVPMRSLDGTSKVEPPLFADSQPMVFDADNHPMLPGQIGTPRLILMAEDNLVNQRVAELQVVKLGYALQIVDNGQLAVQALERAALGDGPTYAAVLMDCQMPVMDGFEATAAIRQAQLPGQPRVPIIAMTANAMLGDRERCLAVGMSDYLSKPIDAGQLAAVLGHWAGPALPSQQDAGHLLAANPDVNFDELEGYFGDDPQVMHKLLMLFQQSATALLDQLDEAIAQQQASRVDALARYLKGTCGNIGMTHMAQMASRLEAQTDALDWPGVQHTRQQLGQAFEAVLQAIAKRQGLEK